MEGVCLEKSCEIIKALINELNTYKEDSLGYKYVCDEQNNIMNDLGNKITKLNNQIKLYEQQSSCMIRKL